MLSTVDKKLEEDEVKNELQSQVKEISKNTTLLRQHELVVPLAGPANTNQAESKPFSDSERLRPRPGIFEVLSKKVK